LTTIFGAATNKINMLTVTYFRKDRYEPSTLKKGGDFYSFVEALRRECEVRQLVKIQGKEIIFGLEGPIVLPRGKLWYVSAEVKGGKWGKHHILLSPNLKTLLKRKETFLRLDSGCLSGMVFGDITCDCLEQLRKFQYLILKRGGVIVHTPAHDGRGWQEYKMANQRIIDEFKVDTIKAAIAFYGDEKIIDQRTYDDCIIILKALGFPPGYKFILGTKNPNKIESLVKEGFRVKEMPVEIKTKNRSLKNSLRAKYDFWDTLRMRINYETSQER
jgi:GTP cyclohydrolase II